MSSKNRVAVNYGVWLLDMITMIISFQTALHIRYGQGEWYNERMHYVVLLTLCLCATVYHFFVGNRTFLKRGYIREVVEVLQFNCCIIIAGMVIVYLAHWSIFMSRIVFAYFFLLNIGLMLVERFLAKYFFRKLFTGETMATRLLIVSGEERMEDTIRRVLKQAEYNGWLVIGAAFADRSIEAETGDNLAIEGIPILGGLKKLTKKMITVPFDEVIIDTPDIPQKDMADIISGFNEMGVTVHYNLELPDLGAGTSIVETFGDYSVITYSTIHASSRRLWIKRVVDIIGSLIGLAVTGVITIFLAPAIKIDSPGPVFFSQVRVGKNGRRFKIYKFRSMYVDAEDRLKELQAQNKVKGLMFKMENDPRVTKVGKFIRRTSLDEFPQFLNVLKGDMSLVGTRPPTEAEFEQYNEHYRRRLSMTPGLTGLWQVSGRSDITDFDEVVKLDLQYIDNWSLSLDFKILLQTVAVVFSHKGAE